MNTELNSDFFSFWKNLSKTKSIKSYQIIQRAIILTYSEKSSFDENTLKAAKKIVKAFSPISNTKKLANGVQPYQSLYDSLMATRYGNPCLFGHLETSSELKANYVAIRDMLIKMSSPKNAFFKLESNLGVE